MNNQTKSELGEYSDETMIHQNIFH